VLGWSLTSSGELKNEEIYTCTPLAKPSGRWPGTTVPYILKTELNAHYLNPLAAMIKTPYINSCAAHLTSISSRIQTTTRAVILLTGFTDLHSALLYSASYLYHEIPLISTVLFSNRCAEYLNLHTCISLPPPGINARYSYNVSHHHHHHHNAP
jgi:hypothetical protein